MSLQGVREIRKVLEMAPYITWPCISYLPGFKLEGKGRKQKRGRERGSELGHGKRQRHGKRKMIHQGHFCKGQNANVLLLLSSQTSEKALAPHSGILAWKIPWTEEPGGLQSMGSLRVGCDRVSSLSLFTFMHWRRKWQPTPVFLPGESQGWGSLVSCHLWGHTESDTTEVT